MQFPAEWEEKTYFVENIFLCFDFCIYVCIYVDRSIKVLERVMKSKFCWNESFSFRQLKMDPKCMKFKWMCSDRKRLACQLWWRTGACKILETKKRNLEYKCAWNSAFNVLVILILYWRSLTVGVLISRFYQNNGVQCHSGTELNISPSENKSKSHKRYSCACFDRRDFELMSQQPGLLGIFVSQKMQFVIYDCDWTWKSFKKWTNNINRI